MITGTNGNVEFKYDQATNSVQALGALNMQNIVIEDKNAGNTASNPSAVILGGAGNTNNGQNSVILGGSGNRNEGQNNLLVNTQNSTSESFNTAIIRGDTVTTNGENIFVNNASSKDINGENIFINGSSSSKGGNNVAIFGSNVNNTKRNVFIFNGNDAVFTPNLDSAFYANGKVAINGSNAVGTLHVHGGVMVQNRGTGYVIPNQSGTIVLFSRDGQTGLCGYDGKVRVPLSESARLYGLCVKTEDIAHTRPANSVSNWETIFPQVWNQNPWVWESPKWIYGHKNKPQRFICDKGYYPDRADPIWKTGVSCIPCQGAEAGDLTCETNKGDDSAPPVLKCPDGYESSTNTEICIKKTKCIKNPNSEWVVGLTYDEQIEEYNMDTQITSVTQKCDIKCDEAKGYKYVAWDPSSSDPNLHNAHCAKSKVEKYQWKCEQKTTWNPFGWTCKKRHNIALGWPYRERYRQCEEYKTEESCYKPKHGIGPRKSSYCYWTPSWSTIVNTTTTYTCTDKKTGAVVDNAFCQDLTKPTDCSITIPAKPLYRCLWGVEHGRLIEWDDEWLSKDTYSTLVSANTSEKCEYVCDDGYEISRTGWTRRRGGGRETGLPICKKKKLAPLNWSCDIANMWCTTGIKTAQQEAPTSYNWTCAGENWGTNASCKKEKDMSTENPVEPCQTTKIREYSQNSHSFIEKYLQVWAFVDPGCSIKNIQYRYQQKCNDGYIADNREVFDKGPIESNTIIPNIIQNLNNLRLSAKSKYKNKIVGIEFTYDVYQGSKMVRSGSFSFDQKYCEDGFLGAKRCIREKQCGSSSNWD